MAKISLKVDMNKLGETDYGKSISQKVVAQLKPYLWGASGSITLKHISDVCGHSEALYALNYCGEEGLRVCRLIATDMAKVVVDAFERDCQEDVQLRKGLDLVCAFVKGSAELEVLEQARAIAEEAEKKYAENPDEECAELGLQAARIVASAASEDAMEAKDGAAYYYIGPEGVPWSPEAFRGINAAFGKFLSRYVEGME
jgi:hypothetical protein